MGLLGGGGGGDRAYSTEGVMGTGLMPGVFGQAGVEHMRKYGTTQEQFAKVAEKVERVETSEHVVVSRVGRELYEKFRTTMFVALRSDGAL